MRGKYGWEAGNRGSGKGDERGHDAVALLLRSASTSSETINQRGQEDPYRKAPWRCQNAGSKLNTHRKSTSSPPGLTDSSGRLTYSGTSNLVVNFVSPIR